MFFGGYPQIYADPNSAISWLDNYILTYVERDVRLIRNVSDLSTFQRFLKLCAGRAGQILDLSSLGADSGISHNTAKQWLGILEAGFIAFRLEPYYRNFSKRVIKSPKLYFYDTGLLCRLLNIKTISELELSPFRGAVFENWCIVETLKAYLNQGLRPQMFFWRDKSFEVDLILEISSHQLAAIEFKSGHTFSNEFLKSPLQLQKVMSSLNVSPTVVYGGNEKQNRSEGKVLDWSSFATQLDEKNFGFFK